LIDRKGIWRVKNLAPAIAKVLLWKTYDFTGRTWPNLE